MSQAFNTILVAPLESAETAVSVGDPSLPPIVVQERPLAEVQGFRDLDITSVLPTQNFEEVLQNLNRIPVDLDTISHSVQLKSQNYDPADFEVDNQGKLLHTLLTDISLGGIHIPNYDHWIRHTASDTFSSRKLTLLNPQNQIAAVVTFGGLITGMPNYNGKPLTPQQARKLGITYDSRWTIDMHVDNYLGDQIQRSTQRIDFGDVPVMIRSTLCTTNGMTEEELARIGEDPQDVGGIFIVNGNEKNVLAQEHLCLNKTLIYHTGGKSKDLPPVARMTINTFNSTKLFELRYKKSVLKMRLSSVRSSKTSVSGIGKQRSVNILRIFRWAGLGRRPDSSGSLPKEFSSEEREQIVELIKKFLPSEPEKINRCLLFLTSSFSEIAVCPDEDKYVAYKLRKDEGKTKKAKVDTGCPGPNFMEACQAEIPVGVNEAVRKQEIENLKLKVINDDLFPQYNELLPADLSVSKKAHQDYIMTLKLLMAAREIAHYLEFLAGYRKVDDPNTWSNKRTQGVGQLMRDLIRNIWRTVIELTQMDLAKKDRKNTYSTSDVLGYLRAHTNLISESINASFVTGLWGVKNRKTKNLLQPLERNNIPAAVAHINTVDVEVSRTDKDPEKRKVSGYGIIDPTDNPEGDSIGFVKKYALTARVTRDHTDTDILALIKDYYIIKNDNASFGIGSRPDLSMVTPLIANGKFMGWCNGVELRAHLINLRRHLLITHETGIVFSRGELFIDLGPSRIIRPVLIVNPETQRLVIDELQAQPEFSDRNLWQASIPELLRLQVLEYLSAWEQEYARIATLPRYLTEHQVMLKEGTLNHKNIFTHMEPDPKTLMGLNSSLTIYPDHNQAPRNTYQAGMSKQRLYANPLKTHRIRMRDGKKKRLVSGRKPLVATQTYELMDLMDKGGSENIVMLMAALPYSEEDSFIGKKEAFELGRMRYIRNVIYDTTAGGNGTEGYQLQKPSSIGKEEQDIYRNIGDNGLPFIGALLREGDCVIGRVYRSDNIVTNESIRLKIGEIGIVDTVEVAEVKSKSTTTCSVRVKLRITRSQMVGDKAAGRYAQKGTIGKILEKCYMYYDESSGIIPDIIQNPHSLPSRMTLSQSMELQAAEAACYTGKRVDASAFVPDRLNDWRAVLLDRGLDPMAYHTMRSGLTSERLVNFIAMGVIDIQVLHHHAIEKVQARGGEKGLVKAVTRQPTKGKSVNGGLRFGEMERDALLSHGAAYFLQERLCLLSDAYTMIMCIKCGIPAYIKEKSLLEQAREESLAKAANKDCGACEKIRLNNLSSLIDTTSKCEDCEKVAFAKSYSPIKCSGCNESNFDQFGKITIPYILKWFTQIFGAMGIFINYKLGKIGRSRAANKAQTTAIDHFAEDQKKQLLEGAEELQDGYRKEAENLETQLEADFYQEDQEDEAEEGDNEFDDDNVDGY